MIDLIFALSEIVITISYLFRDILYLRIATIFALIGYIIGAFIAGLEVEGMKAILLFDGIGLIVNGYEIYKLITERYPILLPEELRVIYKSSFNVMTTYEFYKKIYKLSSQKKYLKSELLAKQNEPVDSLILIRRGMVDVVKDNHVVTKLGQSYFIGEMSLLTHGLASATVIANSDEVECLIWERDKLTRLEKMSPELYSKFQQVIALNLIKKIHNQSGVASPQPSGM